MHRENGLQLIRTPSFCSEFSGRSSSRTPQPLVEWKYGGEYSLVRRRKTSLNYAFPTASYEKMDESSEERYISAHSGGCHGLDTSCEGSAVAFGGNVVPMQVVR